MKYQRSQVKLLDRQMQHIGTINTATEPQEAIEVVLSPGSFYVRDNSPQLLFAAFTGVPVRLNIMIEISAMIADTLCVEADHGICGVHDAVGADLVKTFRHFLFFYMCLQ